MSKRSTKAKNEAPAPAVPKTEVKITAAKGRPMLTWVGKQPLSHVTVFPAQHVETYSPLPLGDGSGVRGSDAWKGCLVAGRHELPAPSGKTAVAVKIIDMLGEEVLVTAEADR